METLTVVRPEKHTIQLKAYPSVHHRQHLLPVIRVEESGKLVGYGQFTVDGGKSIKIPWEQTSPEGTEIRKWIEALMDQYPEAKPTIIRLKVSKGPPNRMIGVGEQNFLVEVNNSPGVIDIHGNFFKLEPHEWESVD